MVGFIKNQICHFSFKKAILILVLGVGVVYIILPLFESDFDKFAKRTIREPGHNSDYQKTTDAVVKYLKENKIEDPIVFLRDDMDGIYVINVDDLNIRGIDRSFVRSGNIKTRTLFGKVYFWKFFTHYDFVIYV